MNLELNEKHVLIAGGTRGIGLACAKAFLAEGSVVTVVGRQPENLDAALKELQEAGGRVQGRCADLTDAASAAKMVDAVWSEVGAIDVLVNAAGAAKRTPFPELTPETWAAAMNSKFFSYVNVFDPTVKKMATRGSGSIVNIVGMGGKVATTTHLGGGSANAALMLASAGLAAAYAAQGVRVNVINPALTMTERLREGLVAEARMKGISTEEAFTQAKARFPMGRLASPEDVADAVLFLSSSRAAYISGVSLSLDGAATPLVV
jgi:NAD(P)-dependent dehydrogenase (short-subunit alcohol dehydrogenase family)